jgi:4-hydroxy-tetrahydrodipicolinate synthase
MAGSSETCLLHDCTRVCPSPDSAVRTWLPRWRRPLAGNGKPRNLRAIRRSDLLVLRICTRACRTGPCLRAASLHTFRTTASKGIAVAQQLSVPIRGLIPAHITPMSEGGAIHWDALTSHLRWLTTVPGVQWITTTAHASEVASLSADERQRMIEHVVSVVPESIGVVAGVYDDGSARAAVEARRSVESGAKALLVFPSGVFAGGSQLRPESQRSHYETIADAVDVPLIIFKYPVGNPLTLSLETTLELCKTIPTVAAIKEWSYDIVEYEDTWRTIKAEAPHVSVLSSFSRSLFASLLIGSDGVLSGHGSIVADLQSELLAAITDGNLARARSVWNRIYPIAVACYADPFFDQHNRMKAALGILGRIPRDATYVRRPLVEVNDTDLALLHSACVSAGIA